MKKIGFLFMTIAPANFPKTLLNQSDNFGTGVIEWDNLVR